MATTKKTTKRKKSTGFSAGTGKTTYQGMKVKPKASLRRRVTSDGAMKEVRERLAPLPESCHYTKTGAQRSAESLRKRGVKARVVTSGKYLCVYTVGKCKKGAK
jgi:hypothetical protein